MTEAEFTEHGSFRKILIDGHSGYSGKGEDIVCAAVSALAQTYLFYMEDLADQGKAKIESLTIMDGHLELYTENESTESMAAYDMAKMGIEAIEEAYPDNVKIFLKKI